MSEESRAAVMRLRQQNRSGLTLELSRPAAGEPDKASRVELRIIQDEAAKRVRLE